MEDSGADTAVRNFLQTFQQDMKDTATLEAFLGRKSSEVMEMRNMLFANRFKSETSVKRLVKGVPTPMEIDWFHRLER